MWPHISNVPGFLGKLETCCHRLFVLVWWAPFMKRLVLLGLLLVCLLPGIASGQLPIKAPKSRPGPFDIELDWGVRIPMRDGVRLSATIYRPRGVRVPLPVLLTLTPYIADSFHDRARYFASYGYTFVIVDSRGRGNSEGKFAPFVNDGHDGYDAVEWLAQQPWCNGKVGMWGGSYGGFVQWATLKELPPHLATIIPAAAPHPGVDFPAPGGIFRCYFVQWLTLVSGTTGNFKLFSDESYWLRRFREAQVNHVPFRFLDGLCGNPSRAFQTWLRHRTPDAYWDRTTPSAEEYAKINLPILTITGQYDANQAGALEYYFRHGRAAPAEAFVKHFLIVGPWDHEGIGTPATKFGGLTFSPASLVPMNELHKAWYDWTLKGGPRPAVLTARVMVYLAGAEHWQPALSLPAIGARPRRLFLGSPTGRADDVFHSGLLASSPPAKSDPDRYTYDPLDVRSAELDKDKLERPLTDQRYALNLFGAGLVYHSEPLERPQLIVGRPRVAAWVAMDVPDTDFQVRLYEIKADGTSILLGEDRLRARYRDSLTQEKLAQPGEVYRYEFKGLPWIARQLAKGSRLRLVFGASTSILVERNYNSGKRQGTETRRDARVAHVTLYHDADHPSCLELPEVPGDDKARMTR
jgi:putative CocE/NonD family hydrolase